MIIINDHHSSCIISPKTPNPTTKTHKSLPLCALLESSRMAKIKHAIMATRPCLISASAIQRRPFGSQHDMGISTSWRLKLKNKKLDWWSCDTWWSICWIIELSRSKTNTNPKKLDISLWVTFLNLLWSIYYQYVKSTKVETTYYPWIDSGPAQLFQDPVWNHIRWNTIMTCFLHLYQGPLASSCFAMVIYTQTIYGWWCSNFRMVMIRFHVEGVFKKSFSTFWYVPSFWHDDDLQLLISDVPVSHTHPLHPDSPSKITTPTHHGSTPDGSLYISPTQTLHDFKGNSSKSPMHVTSTLIPTPQKWRGSIYWPPWYLVPPPVP